MLGSMRYHRRIRRSAADVWALVGDAARLHEWFPGIASCTVDGTTRTIVTGAGIPMPEEILAVRQRRSGASSTGWPARCSSTTAARST